MPSRKRHGREQAAREVVRDQMRTAYEKLAELEARRTELLAEALAAADERATALAAAGAAEKRIAAAVAELVGSGLAQADVAEMMSLDAGELRRVMRAHASGGASRRGGAEPRQNAPDGNGSAAAVTGDGAES